MSNIRPWQVFIALIVLAIASAWALKAQAKPVKVCNIFDHCWIEDDGKPAMHRKRHAPKKRRKPEVRAYVKRDDDDDRVKCYDTVRVVGSQWANESGAEESAQKAWMERVRWSLGESAMSIDAAKNYSKRCSRSSVGELANQVLHRCEVQARPCRPVFESK